MIQRFQIEDLIVQDSSGVVFRALDTDTGKIVAVRRFFPFGLDGGGLNAAEQAAYNVSVARLSGVHHPALRSVVCGGCDPIDGMPYIATEWVDGESLTPFIDQGPLTAESAIELIIKALEVSEILSQTLGDEAVWVETELQTIVVGSEESGRRFTFWISPLKWLGSGDEPRGLESIVKLSEQITGWNDMNTQDQAGHALVGWLNWLRGAAATASLQETRESLAALGGSGPPAPVKRVVTRVARPIKSAKPIKRSKPKTLLFVNLALVAVVATMGGWLLKRQRAKQQALEAPPAAPALAGTSEMEPIKPRAEDSTKSESPSPQPSAEPALSEEERRYRASQLAAELSVASAPPPKATKPKAKPPKTAAAESTAVIQWDNHDALANNAGKPVIVEGVVQDVGSSKSGKTIYLLFSKERNAKATRAGIQIKDSAPGLVTTTLKSFIGKKVQVSGTVSVQTKIANFSSDVTFSDAGSIKVVP